MGFLDIRGQNNYNYLAPAQNFPKISVTLLVSLISMPQFSKYSSSATRNSSKIFENENLSMYRCLFYSPEFSKIFPFRDPYFFLDL
jgi:hypothetical protein